MRNVLMRKRRGKGKKGALQEERRGRYKVFPAATAASLVFFFFACACTQLISNFTSAYLQDRHTNIQTGRQVNNYRRGKEVTLHFKCSEVPNERPRSPCTYVHLCVNFLMMIQHYSAPVSLNLVVVVTTTA